MIATDVAARGLDINDVEFVVNFDFPADIENYIHRIGRTARGEKKGNSVSYLTIEDAPRAGKLRRVLLESGQRVPAALEELEQQADRVKVS